MFPECVGAVDYKLCPLCPSLAACVLDGDLWLLDARSGKTHQLTHTAGMGTVRGLGWWCGGCSADLSSLLAPLSLSPGQPALSWAPFLHHPGVCYQPLPSDRCTWPRPSPAP